MTLWEQNKSPTAQSDEAGQVASVPTLAHQGSTGSETAYRSFVSLPGVIIS